MKFGVEIEAIGATADGAARMVNGQGVPCVSESYNHNVRNHWKVVYDASVHDTRGNSTRGGRGGFELVSPVLEGENGKEQVRKALKGLRDGGCTVNRTCGLHVHIDARSMPLDQLKKLVALYLKHEHLIDAIMPDSRKASANYFCKSLLNRVNGGNYPRTEETRVAAVNQMIRQVLAARDITALGTIINNGDRYYKINLQSFWRHGTIEFRQHAGTVNGAKVLAWIELLEAMVIRAGEIERFNPARVSNKSIRSQFSAFAGNLVSEETRKFFLRRIDALNGTPEPQGFEATE